MNRDKIIILLGGSGRLGSQLSKKLSSTYSVYIIDKNKPKIRNYSRFLCYDFSSNINLSESFNAEITGKEKKKIICIINLIRPEIENNIFYNQKLDLLNKYILNYFNIIKNLIKNCSKVNILNISTINVKLISHQSFEYHYFKASLEFITKYISIKYIKNKIYSNSLRLGLIETNNISKIISKKKIKRLLGKNRLVNYKNIFDFINKTYITNKVLNGTLLTLDNSLSNMDQLHFSDFN
jgi:hypothetical protein